MTATRLVAPEPTLTAWCPLRAAPKGSLKPVTAGNGRTYLVEDNKRSKPVKDEVVDLLTRARLAHPRRREFPLNCPLEVTLAFFYVPPANAGPRDRPSTNRTPDIDKATRLILDALGQSDTIRDDARVVGLVVTAWYARADGVQITVGPARDNNSQPLPGPWR